MKRVYGQKYVVDLDNEPLMNWQYNHFVKDEWDPEYPTNRFNIQIKNAVEQLQKREDLEAPFWIEADIRIISPEEKDR